MRRSLIALVPALLISLGSLNLAEAQTGGGSGGGAVGGGEGAPGGGTGVPGTINFGLRVTPTMMRAINELAAEQGRMMREQGYMTLTPRLRHAINVIAAERRKMMRRRHR